MELSASQRDWLNLCLVPGVGTARFIKLLSRFQTPKAILGASEAELIDVVGPKLAQRIRTYREVSNIEEQERLLAQYDASILTLADVDYPTALAEIYDPPLVLFKRGSLHSGDAQAVAIVGTRNPSSYGERMAEDLAAGLATRGITVVSGMAAGIDAAAHRGALEAGGRTIGVLGCGVDLVYPARNAELMHAIVQQGCVLSPFSMGTKASRGHFPYRNRIISGLTLGTVVVQAPPGSGSLLTAHNALEQGREIFAVPGQVGDKNSQGPHLMLREGAKLVESVEDIVAELALTPGNGVVASPPVPEQTELDEGTPAGVAGVAVPAGLDTREQDICSALGPEGSFVDEIALSCRIPVSEALSVLTLLELKGVVKQHSGKRFSLK